MRHFLSNLINDILFVLLYMRSILKVNDKKAEGVLLIRFSHIGDFIVWLDSAKEYRSIYPGEKITFLCDRYKDIKMLAEKMGYFDEVLVLETRGVSRLKSIREMMKRNYRIVINADLSRTILSDNFALAAGADTRIAAETDFTRISRRKARCSDKAYDRIVSCDGIHTMELIRNAQFIRGLARNQSFRACLPVIPEGLAQDVTSVKNYFAICPGGETPLKYWNEEKYAQVINYIFEKDTKIKCIAVGTGKEKKELRRILKNVVHKERVITLLGRTNILEYIEVLRKARWLITNDTSAAHIAGAVGTFSAAVAVSWDKGRFYPYQVEKKLPDAVLPVGIHANVQCAGCGTYGIDTANPKCLENRRMRCVNRVEAVQMIHVVNYFMEKERNEQQTIRTKIKPKAEQIKIYQH